MNRQSLQLGYWSALFATLTFLVFTLCFVAILFVNPLFMWTDLAAYLDHREKYGQLYVYIAQASMLIFAPLYLVLLHCLYEAAPAQRRIWLRLAISFGIAFATLISLNYFVQISAVRFTLAAGHSEGIEQFLQAKPDSVISAINMLGWTWFFGLSSLFAAPAFGNGREARAIRWLLVANGTFCLLAGVGYVLNIVVLVFLTINLGMGGAVTALTNLLAIHFRKLLGMAADDGASIADAGA